VYDVCVPKITAIIHTHDDGARIGRALESLRACDQVIVVDHGSKDETVSIARQHGATLETAVPGVGPGAYVMDARHEWVLCLQANESLGESLEASLFEWKESEPPDGIAGYRCNVREETEDGWRALGPRLRLANRERINWTDVLPPDNPDCPLLAGDLMRFAKP